MVHLRIVVPSYQAEHTLDLLNAAPSVCNVIYLERVARKPEGDVILCDVAREDASVIISDLRELKIDEEGSLAMLIAMVGILTDQIILIIGAMIVGPEFGPIAGICVAAVEKRRDLFKRSFRALVIGFPVGILATFLAVLLINGTGLLPDDFSQGDHPFTQFISSPDQWSFFVAYLAGMAGVLSLTSAKSGALIGVLISVTTIPAAANIGVAAALGDWHEWLGAVEQLTLNMSAILLAGIGTLF